jgi:hypothetical protein
MLPPQTYFPSNLRRVNDETVCRNANVSEFAECQYTANDSREILSMIDCYNCMHTNTTRLKNDNEPPAHTLP